MIKAKANSKSLFIYIPNIMSLKILFIFIILTNFQFISSFEENKNTKKFLLRDNFEQKTQEKTSEIFPNLPWIAHKLVYENELIKDFKFINFRKIESDDESFRSNIISTSNGEDIDITVAFRGTEFTIFDNIIADIDIEKIKIKGKCEECYVHKGFYKAFKTLSDKLFIELNEEIISFSNKGIGIKNIYFTGHSLGAAMATIAVYDFLNKRSLMDLEYKHFKLCRDISLVTFGSPRVGDKKFRKFLNQKDLLKDSIRVVYGDDIIPALLVGKPLSNYRHIGDFAYYEENEFEYPVVYGRQEINEFTEPEKSFIDRINISRKIRDHKQYYLLDPKGIEFAIKYLRS